MGVPRIRYRSRKWTQRNLISNNEIKKGIGHHGKEKLLNTKKHQKKCVYYEDTDHNSTYCKKTSRALLNEKKNTDGKKVMLQLHWFKRTCSTCNERHRSSICRKSYPSVPTMSSTNQGDVTHPVAIISVDGVKCRALLDTGAGSSYISGGLMNVLRKKPIRKETKHKEMMMNSTTKNIEVFKVQIENVHRDVSFDTELCKVERRELLNYQIHITLI